MGGTLTNTNSSETEIINPCESIKENNMALNTIAMKLTRGWVGYHTEHSEDRNLRRGSNIDRRLGLEKIKGKCLEK